MGNVKRGGIFILKPLKTYLSAPGSSPNLPIFSTNKKVLYKCCSSIAWYALTSCTSSCAENSSLGFKNYITLLFPCQSYIETINLKFLINKLIYCFKYILYNAPTQSFSNFTPYIRKIPLLHAFPIIPP